jgi:GT2 family glycosyltransferase
MTARVTRAAIYEHFVPFDAELSHSVGAPRRLEILIPVYNRGDQVIGLGQDIARERARGRIPENVTIRFLDDASGKRTRQSLETLAAEIGATITTRPNNLGFLGNVNLGFDESDADIIVLLNSDVRVPEGFVERIAAWAGRVPGVAIATVPSFGQIGHRMSSAGGLTWQEVDALLERNLNSRFMNACTAEGYCLVVDRKLTQSPLLDPAFGHGYGEDSDLHYRVIAGGRRSVLFLGMCVSHEGGASYGQLASAGTEYRQGRRLFADRWGPRFRREYPVFNRRLIEALRPVFSAPRVRPHREIVFVLPDVNPRIGGLMVPLRAAKDLTSSGLAVRVVAISHRQEVVLDAFRTIDIRNFDFAAVRRQDLMILAGNDALACWSDAAHRERPRVGMLLQGVDHLLDPTFTTRVHQAIASSDVIFSVSPFTDCIAKTNGATHVEAFTPSLGAATYAADPPSWKERTVDVTVILRPETVKGWWFGAAVANSLAERGYAIEAIGPRWLSEPSLDPRVRVLGTLAPAGVLAALSSTRVFLDPTIAEGFGLTPREAVLRGAHVFTAFAGGNELGVLARHATFFTNHFDSDAVVSKIAERLAMTSPCDASGVVCATCTLSSLEDGEPVRTPLDAAIGRWLAAPDSSGSG